MVRELLLDRLAAADRGYRTAVSSHDTTRRNRTVGNLGMGDTLNSRNRNGHAMLAGRSS